MNRIVREHYPVVSLPEDLREGFPADADVRVTVEAVPKLQEERRSLAELFATAKPSFSSAEEVVEHIRSIRRDWD